MITALITIGIIFVGIILFGLWSCLKMGKISDEKMEVYSQDKE